MHWCQDETLMVVAALNGFSLVWLWFRFKIMKLFKMKCKHSCEDHDAL